MSDTTQNLTYKDRPLVRCGDEIYYGNMTDKYIILFKLLSFKEVSGQPVPDKVQIQMLYTDPDIKGKGKIVRSSEKNSMTVALELATAWLDRGK